MASMALYKRLIRPGKPFLSGGIIEAASRQIHKFIPPLGAFNPDEVAEKKLPFLSAILRLVCNAFLKTHFPGPLGQLIVPASQSDPPWPLPA
jgi:hypothetical protein